MGSTPSRPSAVPNPVAALPRQYGQSVWLDYIRRSLIANGELARMVEEDALGGVTSNPAIFEKAIDGSDDYAAAIAALSVDAGLSAKAIYERLAVEDIQAAADVLRVVYDRTQCKDGYVSLEVSPELARDTEGTLAEARHLWAAVARPNVMIKVPATPEGIPAIRTLLSEGINVNVTLLFAREAYEAVAWAYIEGLEARAKAGAAPRPRVERRQLLRVAHRQPGGRLDRGEDQDRGRRRQGAARVAPGQGGDRQRQARLPELQDDLRGTALGGARGEGGDGAARPLGQHRHQEPGLQRRALRGRADRSGHGQHDPAGHAGRLPRPRPSGTDPRGRSRRRAGDPRRPGAGGDLAPEGHGRAARRRPQEVRGAVRQAPEGGRASQPRGQPGAHQRPGPCAARGSRSRGAEGARRMGRPGRHAAALRRGREPVDRNGRGELAGLAGARAGGARRPHGPAPAPGGSEARGFHPRAPPRHGRLQHVPGGAEGDLRPDPRLSRDARPRLHRPRAGARRRREDRRREDALHRGEQVRLDTRAQHLQGPLLRSREAGAGSREGARPLPGHHRSRARAWSAMRGQQGSATCSRA